VYAAIALRRLDLLHAIGSWRLLSLGVLLYLPALGQIVIQYKPYKIVSRFFLGGAITTLWFAAMVLLPPTAGGLLQRLIFAGVFALVWKVTLIVRSRRAKNPCHSCRGAAFPLCHDHLCRSASLVDELVRDARAADAPFVTLIRQLQSGCGDVEFEVIPYGVAKPLAVIRARREASRRQPPKSR
jgi:hypothetical protein